MAFTTPKSWATSNVLTATDLNTYVRDNISWLATDKPTCRAKLTADQSIANNTFTAVSYTAEDWDTASMHSTASNQSRITIPSGGGGKYLLGFYCFWQINVTGRRVVRLVKNGSTNLGDVEMMKDSASGVSSGGFVIVDSAVAGDFYETQVFQTSGGALNVSASSIPALFFATWYST